MWTFCPVGMSNYEDWADDDLNMGDHPACADKPPTIGYSHIKGSSSMAKAPATTTHPPNSTHLSMPESSPHTEDDVDVEGLTHEEGDADGANDIIAAKQAYGNPEEEEIEQDEQEGELDYKDDAPTDKHEQAADSEVKQAAIWERLGEPVNKSEQATHTEEKQAVIWGWLVEPVDERASTDTETGEMVNLMESVLGIQSTEGRCPDYGVWNCLGNSILDVPTLLFCSFDTLISVEYGNRPAFLWSMLNFMKNWNKHYKLADEPDMGKWEAFRQLCITLYTWALQLYQTLPNFTDHRAVICYSFLCLVY